MTPGELQKLSGPTLEAFYATLEAPERLPVGTFTGEAWLATWPSITRLIGALWQGKTFTGDAVTNRILWAQRVQGRVWIEGSDLIIDYPKLKLRDYLRPVTPWLYFGHMKIGRAMVYFTLVEA